jgi:lipoate-protein ligase A
MQRGGRHQDMRASVRLLPFAIAAGPWNMAADEALLDTAAAGAASLRFYGWSSATLSLGYFQPCADALAFPNLAGLTWLRRPSGGAALVHHHEITYALALPPGRSWQPPGLAWPARMHEVIRAALAHFSIDAHLCREERKLGAVLCFLHHTPGDLLIGSSKVAGSAQRKRRGALMQHGGILLEQSPFTPQLPGIANLASPGPSLSSSGLQAALVEELTRATDWSIEPGDWTSAERRQIDHLLTRYASDDWNRRR